eukprot:gnl/Carplike_NY0171/4540_a6176_392.p1 GENE.gnl/Carplike_NY0171/4540_a6176_392~~gnl/Carplike_NY0171/4540_a6176_392.p1  ORF type:complete len:142 (+),score=14.44 gnl/Carplike_NY0171/4540_a6176_392:45-470(+)
MIHFFLVQNLQGKTRLSKWYSTFSYDERRQLETEVHMAVSARPAKFTNFIEFRDYKLVYRQYATLFFTMAIDPDDNELAYLESIHLFVETMDKYFGNVRELDLIFQFHKVYAILDEMFLAGEIMESGKQVILKQVDTLQFE